MKKFEGLTELAPDVAALPTPCVPPGYHYAGSGLWAANDWWSDPTKHKEVQK